MLFTFSARLLCGGAGPSAQQAGAKRKQENLPPAAPPRSFLLALPPPWRRRLPRDAEIELPALHIDAHHLHPHLVAEPIAPLRPLADQCVRPFLEMVVVVRQRADV